MYVLSLWSVKKDRVIDDESGDDVSVDPTVKD